MRGYCQARSRLNRSDVAAVWTKGADLGGRRIEAKRATHLGALRSPNVTSSRLEGERKGERSCDESARIDLIASESKSLEWREAATSQSCHEWKDGGRGRIYKDWMIPLGRGLIILNNNITRSGQPVQDTQALPPSFHLHL